MATATLTDTTAQRREALRRANRVRVQRKNVRDQVRVLSRTEGAALVADIIESCPPEFATMPIATLFLWPRRMPQRAVLWMLSTVRVREGKPLGAMPERQRRLLAGMLRAYGGERR